MITHVPVLCAEVLQQLRPERGGLFVDCTVGLGGHARALLEAGATRVLGLDTRVLSVDLTPPQQRFDERVTFVRGDTNHLEDALTAEVLGELPRPWLVVEDSAHTFAACLAALRFFASHMQPGELLVIEDGILTDLGLSEDYDGGPNRAVAEFCAGAPAVFAVDRDYCDMFGRNATYNPNGYLRRTSMAFP